MPATQAAAAHAAAGFTPRMLLESPDLHKVAIDNLMATGHEFLGDEDLEMVSALVASSFRNMSRLIAGFEAPRLNEEQKMAALGAMRLMTEPRVQSLGLEVALAIRESRQKQPLYMRRSAMQQDMIHRIAERLRPRFDEIESLHNELLSPSLHDLRQGHRWELTFEPSNIRAAETVGGTWDFNGHRSSQATAVSDATSASITELRGFGHSSPQDLQFFSEAPSKMSDKAVSVLAGVMEQAQFVFGIVNAPPSSPVAAFASSLGLNSRLIVSCNLDGQGESRNNLIGTLVCPLKFGSFGVDVL